VAKVVHSVDSWEANLADYLEVNVEVDWVVNWVANHLEEDNLEVELEGQLVAN
jgi:hypothetical protein